MESGSTRDTEVAAPVGSSTEDPTLVGEDPSEGSKPGGAEIEEPTKGSTLGRYVVLEKLGSGGMGVVYLAYDPELDRRVALKLLQARSGTGSTDAGTEGRARLLREAQAMAKLSHPNVVAVHDIGMLDDRVFVAMEFIKGQTLTEWLGSGGRRWQDVLHKLIDAGEGLAAAHEAGLVHRDFKPDNVMIDHKGRVRVLDFGLARANTSDPELVETETDFENLAESGLSQDLTVPGAIMGTPAYMSPEQHSGRSADEKSDQFSFCVALYEALFNQKPFANDTLPSLVMNVVSGKMREMPASPRVPARIRKAIAKGLLPRAADRHPSMRALLTELRHDPLGGMRRWAIAGAGAMFLGGGVFFAATAGNDDGGLCSGAEERLVGVWDEDKREAIRTAFTATDRPYAEHALHAVETMLDAYAASWIDSHKDACEATHLRGEQSTAIMDRRMACLSANLSELEALVGLLSEADADLVARAIPAVDGLPSLAACSQHRIADTGSPLPEDATTRAAIEALRPRLARIEALRDAGKFAEGIEEAGPVAEEASATGWRPIEAEALFVLGQLQSSGGKADLAEKTLEDAERAAEAGNVPELVVRVRITLADVVGNKLGKFDEGLEWGRDADAALEGLGQPNPELASELARTRGEVLIGQGKQKEALEQLTTALDLLRRSDPSRRDARVAGTIQSMGNALADLGKNDEALARYDEASAINREIYGELHPVIAGDLSNRAGVLWAEGKLDEAGEHVERSVRIATEALGAEHPLVGGYLNNLGVVYEHTGQLDKAAETYQKALDNFEASLEPDHPNIPNAITNLGNVLRDLGKLPEALAYHERAVEYWSKSVGTEHFKYSNAVMNLGSTLKHLERYDEALARYEEALAVRRKVYDDEHTDIGQALEMVADVHHIQGDLDRAEKLYEEALAMRTKVHGDDHVKITYALLGLGRVRIEQGRAKDAIQPLARALKIREANGSGRPGNLAWPKFRLGVALWETGQDKARAVQLATEALAELERDEHPDEEGIGEMREWLAEHGG